MSKKTAAPTLDASRLTVVDMRNEKLYHFQVFIIRFSWYILHRIQVKETARVNDLRKEVAFRIGSEPAKTFLTFDGKRLNSDTLLNSLDFRKDSKLEVGVEVCLSYSVAMIS